MREYMNTFPNDDDNNQQPYWMNDSRNNRSLNNNFVDRDSDFLTGDCPGLIHVIRPGDTLYKLSQRYHVSVSDIMYENPYVNIYNLRIGDELCIPVSRRRYDS